MATTEISWAWPYVFLLLPLPLLIYWLCPPYQGARQLALKVPDIRPYQDLSGGAEISPVWKKWLRIVLLSLAWVALLTATARPQSYGEPIGVPVSGRDLLLCIDISGSMRETDLYAGNNRATRMAVVKQVAKDFVSRRTGDRIGLIMFGSQAYVQTPPTYDHDTVQHFLSEATVGLAGRSTAIGDAIGLGVKRLRDRPDASRVLILLTDGENSAGVVDPIQAARLAAESDIRIYTIGVGSDQQTLSMAFGSGRSELDERTLRAISDTTGGQYFRARNSQELANIYQQIDRLEPTLKDTESFRPLNELFFWPLGLALLLSLVWSSLSSTQIQLRTPESA
ncbi:MAG: VWA domain-containing protein [Granulosicoccus sp.]|nr:VWA domain-containing protein [Granulosicoccus sp.]